MKGSIGILDVDFEWILEVVFFSVILNPALCGCNVPQNFFHIARKRIRSKATNEIKPAKKSEQTGSVAIMLFLKMHFLYNYSS